MVTKELESRMSELESKIRRSKAFIEILNLQGRLSYYLNSNDTDKIADLFSQKDPEVKCEIGDSGVYKGIESIKRFWKARHDLQAIRGYMWVLTLKTPYVQVSKDGNVAKGMWHAFGPMSIFAAPFPCDVEKLTALWLMGKFNNEYVKEDGKWKIRSLYLKVFFVTPYEEGWVKQPVAYSFSVSPEVAKPDTPCEFFRAYHPQGIEHGVSVFFPEPPEPLD
jgi:hypothetical protein